VRSSLHSPLSCPDFLTGIERASRYSRVIPIFILTNAISNATSSERYILPEFFCFRCHERAHKSFLSLSRNRWDRNRPHRSYINLNVSPRCAAALRYFASRARRVHLARARFLFITATNGKRAKSLTTTAPYFIIPTSRFSLLHVSRRPHHAPPLLPSAFFYRAL